MFRKLTFLIVAITGLALVACSEPAEREAKYVDRGKMLFEDGNYEKAELEFRNALQINPMGSESRFHLGLIDEIEGKLPKALKKFKRVHQQDPAHVGAIIKLGNIYLITNNLGFASDMAKEAAAIEPGSADLHALRAGISLRRGEIEESAAEAKAALAKNPAHVAAAGVLARVHSDRGETKEAIAILDTAINLNQENQNLRRVKILLHLENGDLASAEMIYLELFELAPDFFDYRKELVRQYIAHERLDDGENLLRNLVAEFPSDNEPKKLLVDYLLNQRSFKAAESELMGYVAIDPENDDLLIILAGIYQAEGLTDKAVIVYQDILDQNSFGPHAVQAWVSLAQIHLQRDEVASATELLDKVMEEDPGNSVALLLRSRVYLVGDDYSSATLNLRKLLRDEPGSRPALVLLTQAHLMANEPDLAVESLRSLVQIDPLNDLARSLLASLLTRSGEMDAAFPLLEEVLAQQPGNIDALIGKFQILLSREAWLEAEDVARKVVHHRDGGARGHELLGRLFHQQVRYQDAAAEFLAALEIDAGLEGSLNGLIRAYFSQDRQPAAERFLEERVAKNPEDALAYKLLGEAYQQRDGGGVEAEQAFKRALTLRPGWPEPYLRLAILYRDEKDTAQMVDVLERGLKQAPGHEALSFALASSYEEAGDPMEAIKTYEAMIRSNANNVAVANNLVALISDYDFENESRLELAENLSRPFEASKQAVLLDTLGWVHYRLGNFQQAISYLESALANGGNHPQVHYHLGMVYLELGKPDLARRELELAIQGEAVFPGVEKARQALAEL